MKERDQNNELTSEKKRKWIEDWEEIAKMIEEDHAAWEAGKDVWLASGQEGFNRDEGIY